MLDDPGMGGVRGWAFKWAERARSSPYYPALRHPVFRKVLPGAALSALGDGMSAVAIAWPAHPESRTHSPSGGRNPTSRALQVSFMLPG